MSKTYIKCPKRIQNVQNVYKMSKTYKKCNKTYTKCNKKYTKIKYPIII